MKEAEAAIDLEILDPNSSIKGSEKVVKDDKPNTDEEPFHKQVIKKTMREAFDKNLILISPRNNDSTNKR